MGVSFNTKRIVAERWSSVLTIVFRLSGLLYESNDETNGRLHVTYGSSRRDETLFMYLFSPIKISLRPEGTRRRQPSTNISQRTRFVRNTRNTIKSHHSMRLCFLFQKSCRKHASRRRTTSRYTVPEMAAVGVFVGERRLRSR